VRIDRLVFGMGDRVTGWGCVREADGGIWFDPPQAVPLAWGQPLPLSRYAVRLEGADLGAVPTDLGADGSIPGFATVTGVWWGDRIAVETLSPVPPAPRRPAAGSWWTRPPCPPPAGGWPVGVNGRPADNLTVDLGDLEATGAAVTVVQFRPGPGRLVLVVAAADEEAVERRLRPQLGAQLCVVRSRWTRVQLDAVTAVLMEKRDSWGIGGFGERGDDDGQAYVEATPFRVTADMAAWAASLPDGLLHVCPTLAPAP
jgi:hypothetical protein